MVSPDADREQLQRYEMQSYAWRCTDPERKLETWDQESLSSHRGTMAISSLVFLNYSLPNSTNHLTKLNLILKMASECKILSNDVNYVEKCFSQPLLDLREKEKGEREKGWQHLGEMVQNILRITVSQRIGSLLQKTVIFFPHLIRTL